MERAGAWFFSAIRGRRVRSVYARPIHVSEHATRLVTDRGPRCFAAIAAIVTIPSKEQVRKPSFHVPQRCKSLRYKSLAYWYVLPPYYSTVKRIGPVFTANKRALPFCDKRACPASRMDAHARLSQKCRAAHGVCMRRGHAAHGAVHPALHPRSVTYSDTIAIFLPAPELPTRLCTQHRLSRRRMCCCLHLIT